MSKIGGRLAYQKLDFERLEVDASVAEKIFEDNRYILIEIEFMVWMERLARLTYMNEKFTNRLLTAVFNYIKCIFTKSQK